MKMTKEELVEFVKGHPACHLATLEKGRPRVRGMMPYRFDGTSFVMHTGTEKAVWRQIMEDPRVELCFNDFEKFLQVRFSGRVEPIDDGALKAEIVEARPFLKPWIEAKGMGFMSVFRVVDLEVSIWTMATNLEPTCWERL